RGGDDAEGPADRDAAAALELEGAHVGRAGAGEAAVGDVDSRPRQEVGRRGQGVVGRVDRLRRGGQVEVGVDEERRRAVAAGPRVTRRDEGRVAGEVAV